MHDNADHHLLQARLVRAVTATGRRPSIAFEMLDETQQATIDAIPKGEAGNPSAVRDAVRWDQSGWPEFKLYRPIFDAAADAGLPIVAANLPREKIRAASRAGIDSLPAPVRERIERQGPLSDKAREELRGEMAESHCGELPESMLDPLILGQRARDAQLATRLVAGASPDGAILITGSGHVRRDRGVPSYLTPEEASAGGGLLAVAFQEVSAERPRVEDYSGITREQFDFVVFTPGAKREDPCEKLREQMRKHHPPVGTEDSGTRL